MTTAETSSGIKRAVYEGRLAHTPGKLSPSSLKQSKSGKIVSKKASISAKKNFNKQGDSGPKGWVAACKLAASELNEWPVPIKKGTKFYNLAKKYFDAMN